LRHEPVDHPVKGHIVVFPRARQFLHPVAMARRDGGQELDGDGAVLQLHEDGILGVGDLGHRALLFCLFNDT